MLTTESPSNPERAWSIEIAALAIDGLPKPNLSLLPHRCYAQLLIDGQTKRTSDADRRSDAARWPEKFTFRSEDLPTLEIRIYDRRRSLGKYRFVGGIKEGIETLLSLESDQVTIRKLDPLEASGKIQGRITFHITSQLLHQSSSDMLRIGDEVSRAQHLLDRSSVPPAVLELAGQITDSTNNATESIKYTAAYLKPLVDTLDVFVKAVDKLAEVHPYAKVAWTVLSFVYKAMISQKFRDEAINRLAVTMCDTYDFLCEAEHVKRFDSQAKILAIIAKQTEECAHFIQGYAETKSFLTRTAKHLFSSVDDKITLYQEKFKHFMEAFQGHAVLQTEIVVTRVLDTVSVVASAIDLNDLPYADGVSYHETRGCLPGTRGDTLEKIQVLLNGAADEECPRILLLTGVAGYGKSAIASSIAKWFDDRNRLGSSFFFNRNDNTRNQIDNVFTTIARDIADLNPEIKEKLWSTIKDRRSLRKTKNVHDQFIQLVWDPTKNLTIIGPIVIVVDGLDECGDQTSRKTLLNVLANDFSELPKNFRLLLTARPEKDIMRDLPSLPFVRHIQMENIDEQSTREDFSTFVLTELYDIKDELEVEWPDMTWRDELVERADDLFIWISTACRFIKNEGQGGIDYPDQLKLVLSDSPRTRLLGPLDRLYQNVLTSAFEENNVGVMTRFKTVLGKILTVKIPLSSIGLSDLLELDDSAHYKDSKSVVRSVVSFLGSLLIGTMEPTTPIQILHLSFNDFLTDRSRSKGFFIDMKTQRHSMAILSLDIMNQRLRRDIIKTGDPFGSNPSIQDVQSRMMNFEALRYVCRYWVDHVVDLEICEESFLNRIRNFLHRDALHWIEALSLTHQLESGIMCLNRLEDWLKKQQSCDTDDVMELIRDLKRLLWSFGQMIDAHALQVYNSAMVFLPRKTVLFKHYGGQDQCACTVVNIRETWSPLLATLRGHDNPVNRVAFSPDGSRLASCSNDETVRLWDAYTGSAIGEPMVGHTNAVYSISFSPDGSHLASCSSDKTVRLWDAHTGRAIGDAMVGHTDSIWLVSFSPDGRRLASCSYDKTVRLWDAKTGSAIEDAMVGHTDDVSSVSFSPDSGRLASGSSDKTVRLWDAHTGRAIGDTMVGHTEGISSITFSPDGGRLASCSSDKTAKLWDAHTGKAIGDTMVGHTEGISSIAFSPDGGRLASCSFDMTVRLWDAHTGRMIGDAIVGHTNSVTFICFSPDGNRVASCSFDRTIRLWDSYTGRAIGDAMVGHASEVNSISFSPDGSRLVSCSDDTTVRLWDTYSSRSVGDSMVSHTDAVTSISFSPDDSRFASCSRDKTVRLWKHMGEPVGDAMIGHNDGVDSISFSPDGSRLASRSKDKTVRLWDANTGRAIGDPIVHTDTIGSIDFSPDSSRLASCSYDLTVRLWDALTGKAIGDAMSGHTDSIRLISFSPDSSRLVSSSDDNTMRLWDGQTGNAIGDSMIGHTEPVDSVAFSPDSNRLASRSCDKIVRLWDALTGKAIGGAMVGHTNWVFSVTFSPDGSRLASCSFDKTVRLWNAHTGRAIGDAMVGHTDCVNCVSFSPDGSRLASGSTDKTVRLWDVHTGKAIGNAMGGHTDSIYFVSFYPDGSHVVTHSSVETCVWESQSAGLIDAGGPTRISGTTVTREAGNGWLLVNGNRILWIPDEYRGDITRGVKTIDGTTVCIGGWLGSVITIKIPDSQNL